ncbi:hypothetical protein X734_16965 [Mesorhizobium sp. L2C084A000]|nr:hypothetical protein X734_16965 [Mesorhizobium sp. L2C084A000]
MNLALEEQDLLIVQEEEARGGWAASRFFSLSG